MFPYLRITDSFQLASFQVIYGVSILLGLLVLLWDSRRYKTDSKLFWDAIFYLAIGFLIGSKLFYVVFFDWSNLVKAPIATIMNPTGSMYYGVELCGLITFLFFMYIKKANPLNMLDSIALGLSLAHGLGRIGCFASGCCYGKPTDSIFGVHFPFLSVFVHPTQLYESAYVLVLFAALLFLRRKKFPPGLLYGIYAICYGMGRFFIEFLRNDAYQAGFLRISPSQHIGLISVIVGTALLWFINKKQLAVSK